jgi:hypothetical protein
MLYACLNQRFTYITQATEELEDTLSQVNGRRKMESREKDNIRSQKSGGAGERQWGGEVTRVGK